ncbi:MAG: hypothetical protein IPK75_18865 [Acidobacteria bacterium]|nr:hypothetical protein [Acidobacteriota bacterium]
MKHYTIAGRYYGYFADAPEGATEVPSRPLVDDATWDGAAWLLPAGGDWIAGFCAQVDAEANTRAAKVATEHHALNDIMLGQLYEALLLTLSADPSPTEAEYPLLASLVGIAPGVTTLPEAAPYLLATARGWGAIAGPINRTRLIAKAQIATCTTSEELRAVRDGIVWPG